jgi:hypothetical protein
MTELSYQESALCVTKILNRIKCLQMMLLNIMGYFFFAIRKNWHLPGAGGPHL